MIQSSATIIGRSSIPIGMMAQLEFSRPYREPSGEDAKAWDENSDCGRIRSVLSRDHAITCGWVFDELYRLGKLGDLTRKKVSQSLHHMANRRDAVVRREINHKGNSIWRLI